MSNKREWRCVVCGYVAEGPEPPEECPVCGASRAEFELIEQQAQWVCEVCGYLEEGSSPPEYCPVCGAGAEAFERHEPAAAVEISRDISRVVVVGAGIAGVQAVEAARRAGYRGRLTLISEEDCLPYYRLNLTLYLAGEVSADDLLIHPSQWYEEHDVELLLGNPVQSLHPDRQTVELSDGQTLSYDKLVLTTGAHGFCPPVPGADSEGVLVFRSQADADHLRELAGSSARCVCIGGGLLGLETAGALAKHGVKTTLVEVNDFLMNRQLSRQPAELLAEEVRSRGIALELGAKIEGISQRAEGLSVKLAGGQSLAADFVVFSAGIRANLELPQQAGLETNRGVVVNNYLQTSHADIYAAGDGAEVGGVVSGIWPVSMEQGRLAGLNALGLQEEYQAKPPHNQLKVLGVPIFSVGRFEAEPEELCLESSGQGTYTRLVLRDGVLLGAILYGDTRHMQLLQETAERGRKITQENPSTVEAVIEELREN